MNENVHVMIAWLLTCFTSYSVPIVNGDWRAMADHHVVFSQDRMSPSGGVLRDAAHGGQAHKPDQVQLSAGSVKHIQ